MTTAPDRIALVRLIMAEAPFFPALVRAEQPSSTMHGNVAAFLARLAGQGSLAITDPAEAAEHLVALTVNQINVRTTFGIVPIGDAEVEDVRAESKFPEDGEVAGDVIFSPGEDGQPTWLHSPNS